MPFIFGWLAGDLAGRALFSRVVMTFGLWCGIAIVGYKVGAANVSPRAGTALAILFPALLLAWSLVRPAGSRAKMWLIEGMLVMIATAQIWFGLKAAFAIVGGQFRLESMLRAFVPVLIVLAFWALRMALLGWVRRSDARLGARSVVRHG